MMFGSKKDGGSMAHAIHKKHFNAHAPEKDEDSSSEYNHQNAMHDSMHELHEAVHKGDVKRMARAFSVAHNLIKSHSEDADNMSNEEMQDSANGDIGLSAGYTGYS